MTMMNSQIPVYNKGRTAKICGSITVGSNVWTMVPMAFVEQYGYDPDFQFDYSSFSNQLRSVDSDGRKTFDFWCPLSAVDGYGRHALSIYKGFHQIGANAVLRTDGWGIDSNFLPQEINNARYMSASKMPLKVALQMTLPYHLFPSQSVSKVIITQFETDHIPEKHIQSVNTMDRLIVTSRFQVDVWKKSGLTIPISVLTSGVDTDHFRYVDRARNGKFKILILGVLTGRKNPLGAIRIFQHASKGDPNWQLCIKTRKGTDGFPEVQRVAENDPRIQVILEDIPPQQVVNFYHQFDCLLWPSKGEGCGLPPMEAMSTGMELVCSDNSGMKDFVDSEWCYPIKTAGMEPANIPGQGFSNRYTTQFGQVGNWWVPDEHHGVEQLIKCHDNWQEGKGKGKKGADYIRSHHNLSVQAESVLKVMEEYL